jgi:hypothetical protein
LSPAENALARYLVARSKRLKLASELTPEDDSKSPIGRGSELQKQTKQKIAGELAETGIPYGAILDAATTLRQKLGLKQ